MHHENNNARRCVIRRMSASQTDAGLSETPTARSCRRDRAPKVAVRNRVTCDPRERGKAHRSAGPFLDVRLASDVELPLGNSQGLY